MSWGFGFESEGGSKGAIRKGLGNTSIDGGARWMRLVSDNQKQMER